MTAENIFTTRFATEEDTALILEYILKLARYEKLEHEVTATEEELYNSIFVRKKAEVIFACENGKEVGFALFFNNFSTFNGHENLYLEDLYIDEEHRGKGYGKQMFKTLAKIAHERGYKRVDWWCLDWNVPSVEFYKRLGAVPMDEWTIFRLQKAAIDDLAK